MCHTCARKLQPPLQFIKTYVLVLALEQSTKLNQLNKFQRTKCGKMGAKLLNLYCYCQNRNYSHFTVFPGISSSAKDDLRASTHTLGQC